MGLFRKIIFLGTCILFACFKTSGENTAAQCAQFGANDDYNNWNLDRKLKTGYYTIAAEDFDVKYINAIGTRYYILVQDIFATIVSPKSDGSCPWEFKHLAPACHIEPCVPNQQVRMNMYLVKQEGRILQGWLHVEIELLDRSDEIEIIYIQMRDESFNAIGEFVTTDTHPGATCKPSKDYLATPKHYEFFPCSATGLREAKTSAAIMMARKDYYHYPKVKDNGWVHEGSVARGVHFLWTFGEYWCSRHEKIQPYAYILTRKNRVQYDTTGTCAQNPSALMLRKIPTYWLHPKWFGAADIILPHGKLDCSELAINDDNGQVSPAAANSWFRSTPSIVQLYYDNWHPRNRYPLKVLDANGVDTGAKRYGSNLCQADPVDKTQTKATVPVFSGRCAHHFAKDVSPKFFHGCNLDINSPEFAEVRPIIDQFQSLKVYREKKQKDRWALCTAPCQPPNSTKDLEDIQKYPPGAGVNSTKNETMTVGRNDFRTKAKTQKFWHGRKYHGLLSSIVTFFLTPLYIFVSRYYKETFMARRCYGVPMWYWVHVFGIIVSGMLFASGFAAITPNIPVWGRSLHPFGQAHTGIGYISFLIFGFLLLFGGFRCTPRIDRGGKWLRIITLAGHALLGFMHYLLNLLAVGLSTGIPQSPSLKDCDKKTGMPEGDSPVLVAVVVFLVVDLIIHLVLTIVQCTIDRRSGVNRRGWWFPLIPLLPMSSISDYMGGFLRKIALILYLVLTLVFTLAVVYLIAEKDLPDNCRIGPMTCKHAFGCTKLAIQYEQWYLSKGGKIDVKYFS